MAQSFTLKLGREAAEKRPWIRSAINGLEASMLGLFWWTCSKLSVEAASNFGGFLLRAFGPILPKHQHLLQNLAIANPHLSEGERHKLARKAWTNIGRGMAEYPHIDKIITDSSHRRVEIVDHYGLEKLTAGEGTAVMVGAHIGNWEIGATICRLRHFPMDSIHSKLSNPKIDHLLMEQRKKLGCGFIPADNAMRQMLRHLNQGRNLALLIDQRYRNGVMLPFFGENTESGVGAAAMALKTKSDFVPVRIERKKNAHFILTFHQPIEPDPDISNRSDQAAYMTQKVLELFENWIKEQPEQWLCLKKRWPREVYKKHGFVQDDPADDLIQTTNSLS